MQNRLISRARISDSIWVVQVKTSQKAENSSSFSPQAQPLRYIDALTQAQPLLYVAELMEFKLDL